MKCRTSNKLKLSVIISTFILFFMMFFNFSQVNAVALPTADGQYYRFKRANITYEEFDKLIRINESDNIKVYKQDGTELSKDELVGTGMKAVYNDQTNYIIIKGDINGDGKATPTDLSKLKQLLVGTAKFDYCYQKAVDMNNDSQITSVDVSQLKMLLVGLTLPEEEIDPNDKSPRLDGEIEILRSTTEAAHEVTITINWPTGKNLENCKKQVSVDGGKTFKDYEGIIILKENAFVIARYGEPDKMPAGEVTALINNIDNIEPEDFTFTAKATTSSITVEAETIDKLKDYTGTLVEGRCSGVEKYLYKLDDGEWQESNVFENLTQDTEYKIYVKAIDYAGNEKEASNNAMTLRTDTIKEPGQTGIKVEYSKTTPTNEIVTVTFSIVDETLKDNYVIQYQVNSLSGEWTEGTEYQATGNCVIYARLADKSGQASKTYVTANVKNIDHLRPLDFTPEVTYNSSTKKTVVSAANAKDAPADATNMCSGLADIYYFTWVYKDGTQGEPSTTPISSNKYEISGDLINNPDKTNPIIGFYVEVQDKVGNTRTSQVKYIADVDIDDGGNTGGGSGGGGTGGGSGSGGNSGSGGSSDSGGSGNGVGRDYNDGPGNNTIQGADHSYNNPLIPVGFRAIDTPDASWGPYLPSGWDNGLVIEDRSGNQFIWVPVPCRKGTDPKVAIDNMILNMRPVLTENAGKVLYEDFPECVIENTEMSDVTGKYGYLYSAEMLQQVKDYQGFYIGRYEAGKKNGILAVQKGLEPILNLSYSDFKNLAESMYKSPYVVSGLPCGVHWDLLSAWIAKTYGVDFVTRNTTMDGNISNSIYEFSGLYGILDDVGIDRGYVFQNGEITSSEYSSDMLSTGSMEKFKIKNAYDLWGNASEVTTETMSWSYKKCKITRGAGVGYSLYSSNWLYEKNRVGLLLREVDTVPEGMNYQRGFRPVLFLGENFNVGGYNRTIDGGEAKYNNPIIPAGYYPVDTSAAKWGDGKRPAVDWNKGLVITDAIDKSGKSIGNEFVWVPVDGTNVKYEKWLEVYLQHSETGESEIPESLKKKGYTEEEMIKRFGGFYIARYETSLNSSGNIQTKANQKVMTNISYNQAVDLVNKYPNRGTTVVGIVTGKQWDTTMKWIANQIGKARVESDSSSWGIYSSSLGYTGRRVARNIYDLAGNAWELTSETYGEKIIYRGGSAYNSGSSAPAGYRDAYAKEYSDGATTFRMCLYVEGDNYGVSDVHVPDKNINIEFTQDITQNTDKSVTVTMKTDHPTGNIVYSVGNSVNGSGWKQGEQFVLGENATIIAKVVDESGNALSTMKYYRVGNINLGFRITSVQRFSFEYIVYRFELTRKEDGKENIFRTTDKRGTKIYRDSLLFSNIGNEVVEHSNGYLYSIFLPYASSGSLNKVNYLFGPNDGKPGYQSSRENCIGRYSNTEENPYEFTMSFNERKKEINFDDIRFLNGGSSLFDFDQNDNYRDNYIEHCYINVDTYLSDVLYNGSGKIKFTDSSTVEGYTYNQNRYTLHLTYLKSDNSKEVCFKIDPVEISDVYPEQPSKTSGTKKAYIGGCIYSFDKAYVEKNYGNFVITGGWGTKEEPYVLEGKFPIYTVVQN